MTETMNWRRPWMDYQDGGFSGKPTGSGWTSVSSSPTPPNLQDGFRRSSTTSLSNLLSSAPPSVGPSPPYNMELSGSRSPKRVRVHYDQPHPSSDQGFRQLPEISIPATQPLATMSPPRPPEMPPSSSGNRWSQNASSHESLSHTTLPPLQCSNCRHLTGIVHELVTAVIDLDGGMRGGMAIAIQEHAQLLQAPDVGEKGLRKSLEWALSAIQTNTTVVRERLNSYLSSPEHGRVSNHKVPVFPEEKVALHLTAHERSRDDPSQRTKSETMDDPWRKRDNPRLSSSPDPQRRSSFVIDSLPSVGQSSHSWNRSGPPSTYSPSQGPRPALMLPSPSSLNFPSSASTTIPSTSPLSTQSESAQAAHFRDLQHQVSTKSLALQTLQREHDHLLSSYSRIQTRQVTLEKKSQVSDAEINSLTEEKLRLQSQVDDLEIQVEELIKSRDEARKQSVANGGQYMQIMSMASRLEAQGASDKKKWKMEKDELEEKIRILTGEKDALVREKLEAQQVAERITTATSPVGCACGMTHTPPSSMPLDSSEFDDMRSRSPDSLRTENVRLRRRCVNLETTLMNLRAEVGQLVEISQRVIQHTGITPLMSPAHIREGRDDSASFPPNPLEENLVRQDKDTTMQSARLSASPDPKRKREAEDESRVVQRSLP